MLRIVGNQRKAQSLHCLLAIGDFLSEVHIKAISPCNDLIASKLQYTHYFRGSNLAAISALELIESFGEHSVTACSNGEYFKTYLSTLASGRIMAKAAEIIREPSIRLLLGGLNVEIVDHLRSEVLFSE